MKSLESLLVLPVALTLMACGSQKSAQLIQSDSASQIVSGVSVSKDEAIAQSTVGLIIEAQSGMQSTCTGTLIEKNIVLTAAHCFMADPEDPIAFVAVAFVNSFSEVSQTTARGANGAIMHPDFGPKPEDKGTWDDVALVKFAGDLPAGYKPVPYLKDVSKTQKGLAMTIAGYGLTSPAGDEAKPEEISIGTLLKASVKLADAQYNGGELVTDIKESPASTCKGDSGGPAYAEIDGQLTVVGITSRGINRRCDDISIFTSTAFQASFIADSIQVLQAQ